MYKFSPRPGTKAANMDNKYIAKFTIDERFNKLKEQQTKISEKQLYRFVGTNQKVLVEGPSKNNSKKSSGRTEGNHIVILDKLVDTNTIVDCEITKNTPYILYGETI